MVVTVAEAQPLDDIHLTSISNSAKGFVRYVIYWYGSVQYLDAMSIMSVSINPVPRFDSTNTKQFFQEPNKTMPENGKKRPRSDYYDRLLFQCQRELHKVAKQTKNFETKKLIRQLKQTPINNHKPSIETRLAQWKEYDIEPVVQECVRRLGVPALNPNAEEERTDVGVPSSWMLDRIVQHNRMKVTMEKWQEEVNKYRRWCTARKSDNPNKFVSRENSLFVQLGQRGMDAPDEKTLPNNKKRKNRQGQRARKAKALALNAKREGRMLLPEESLNWRAKKKDHEDTKEDKPLRIATTRKPAAKTTSNDESLHPSWQAHKQTKDSIVAFQGKKIAF